jgi:hypothetical protein
LQLPDFARAVLAQKIYHQRPNLTSNLTFKLQVYSGRFADLSSAAENVSNSESMQAGNSWTLMVVINTVVHLKEAEVLRISIWETLVNFNKQYGM